MSDDKKDIELGNKVKEHLINLGIETPVNNEYYYSDEVKISKLTDIYNQAHTVMGLDLSDDSIQDTPKRISKLMVYESMKGLDYKNFPKMTVVENKFYDGMVSVNDLLIFSLCEHHWERVIMRVSIAYVPKKQVVGLSKFSRIADFFGSRPIVQERYTKQLFESLKFILDTDDVAVHVRGIHLCMFARGVQEPCSSTTTTCLGGKFMNDLSARQEFMNGIDITSPIIPK